MEKYYKLTGWDKIINLDCLSNINIFLETIQPIEYIGHGGTCVTFKKSEASDIVYKICLKKKISNSKKFIMLSNFLIKNNIKVLGVVDVLFENDDFYVYTQKYCCPISDIKNNHIAMSKILKIISSLLQKNIKITDLYYKNFGIYDQDVYLYDFHDFDFVFSNDDYYICHIAQMFGKYLNIDINGGDVCVLDDLIINEFYKIHFHNDVSDLLSLLYNHHYNEAISLLSKIINDIDNKIIKKYDDYQHYDINEHGIILLRSHTLEKYKIFEKLLCLINDKISTLVDYGCCIGGIGLKIAQCNPLLSVTLNNITKSELVICKENVDLLCIKNVLVENKNVFDDNNTYDVCMYFAILHHILKTHTMDEIITMLCKQVNKYAIIELPFDNDALLLKVIEYNSIDYDHGFYYLRDTFTFSTKIKEYFEIMYSGKINYESDDLNRHVFILKKINFD